MDTKMRVRTRGVPYSKAGPYEVETVPFRKTDQVGPLLQVSETRGIIRDHSTIVDSTPNPWVRWHSAEPWRRAPGYIKHTKWVNEAPSYDGSLFPPGTFDGTFLRVNRWDDVRGRTWFDGEDWSLYNGSVPFDHEVYDRTMLPLFDPAQHNNWVAEVARLAAQPIKKKLSGLEFSLGNLEMLSSIQKSMEQTPSRIRAAIRMQEESLATLRARQKERFRKEREDAIARKEEVLGKMYSAEYSGRLKDLASAFVQYSFVWAPLVQDIQAVSSIYQDTLKELEDLRALARKPLEFREGFTEKLPSYAHKEWTEFHWPMFYGWRTPAKFRIRQLGDYVVKHNFSCQRYSTLHPDGLGNLIRALMVGFFGNMLSALWETIPGSFIIDRIVPIQTILERAWSLQPIAGGGGIVLMDVSHSVKRYARFEIQRQILHSVSDHDTYTWVPWAVFRREEYERWPGIPAYDWLEDTILNRMIGPEFGLILAALIGSNRYTNYR